MPREKESYRDTIALLNELIPGSAVATIDECAAVLHYNSQNSVRRFLASHGISPQNGRVNKAELARAMCTK